METSILSRENLKKVKEVLYRRRDRTYSRRLEVSFDTLMRVVARISMTTATSEAS